MISKTETIKKIEKLSAQLKVLDEKKELRIMEYEEILSFIKHNKPWIQCTLEDTVPENAVSAAEYIRGIYQRV